MIDLLDCLLRELFVSQVSGLAASQVWFQPPDQDWRTYVANLTSGAVAVNIYLVDVRENRTYLTNDWQKVKVSNGLVQVEPPPPRVDCHYLITTWSPASPSQSVEPQLDEHALLDQLMKALFQNVPLNPSRIYPPGAKSLGLWPPEVQESDLPTDIMPIEGFPKYAEFWGTMGHEGRWRPAIWLIVTIPILLDRTTSGYEVTTVSTNYLQSGGPASSDVLIEIGGSVLDQANPLPSGSPAPIDGAWVRLETVASRGLQSATTDAEGHFTFTGLRATTYQLRYGANGYGPKTRLVDVPSLTGEYDLVFP